MTSPGRKMVSILTPTWRRPELLAEAIVNVRNQSYRPLEHVIVSDGSDRATARVAVAALDCAETLDPSRDVAMRFVQLGRNWSSFLEDSFCAAPLTVAMLLASGEYQGWLADDERMDPDHVEALVSALESSGADFAYSRVRLWWPSGRRETIGSDPPTCGQITNVLYRTEILRHGLFPFGAGMTADWACISQWQSRGARHAFVDRVTLAHRVDH